MVAQRHEKLQIGLERGHCQTCQVVEETIARVPVVVVDLAEILEESGRSEHLMQELKVMEKYETLETGSVEVPCLRCLNRTERLEMVVVHEPTMVQRVKASETGDRLLPLGVRDVPLLARKMEVLGRQDVNSKSDLPQSVLQLLLSKTANGVQR